MFKDSTMAGVVYGVLVASVAFLTLVYFERLTFIPQPLLKVLQPPKLQLLMLGVYMIMFRIIMVNCRQIKTGKAFLFIIILSALLMFLKFR